MPDLLLNQLFAGSCAGNSARVEPSLGNAAAWLMMNLNLAEGFDMCVGCNNQRALHRIEHDIRCNALRFAPFIAPYAWRSC